MGSLVRSVKSLGEENAALKRAAALAEESGTTTIVANAGNARQRTVFAPSLASSGDSPGGVPSSPRIGASPSFVALGAPAGGSLPSLDRRTMMRAASSRKGFEAQVRRWTMGLF